MQVSQRTSLGIHERIIATERLAIIDTARHGTRTTTTFAINTCTSATLEMRCVPVSEKYRDIKNRRLVSASQILNQAMFSVIIIVLNQILSLQFRFVPGPKQVPYLSASFIKGRCLDHQLVPILVSSSHDSLLYNALY